jgi:hypothetical protein
VSFQLKPLGVLDSPNRGTLSLRHFLIVRDEPVDDVVIVASSRKSQQHLSTETRPFGSMDRHGIETGSEKLTDSQLRRQCQCHL